MSSQPGHRRSPLPRLLAILLGLVLAWALHLGIPAHAETAAPPVPIRSLSPAAPPRPVLADAAGTADGSGVDSAGGSGAGGGSGGRGGDASGPTSAQGRWQWPLAAPHEIVGPFVAPEHDYGAGHRGIDIRGGGGEVLAVEAGTVRFAGTVAGRGVVSILHADGLLSTYEPVDAEVSAGTAVAAGERIGTLEQDAAGGHCEEACLHLGARRGGRDYQDPEPLLRGARPSVLLPLAGLDEVLGVLGDASRSAG